MSLRSVALALSLSPATCPAIAAGAEPARVAVVPVVVAPEDPPSGASILEAVARAARHRLELALISEEETFATGSGDLADRVRDCGADVPCAAAELARLGVPYVLVVVVNTQLVPPLAGARLIDTRAGRLVAESVERVEPRPGAPASRGHGALLEGVTIRAAEVFDGGGYRVLARLTVRASPPEAVVHLASSERGDLEDRGAGDLVRPTAGVALVPPGRWRVVATAGDRSSEVVDVELGPGEERTVELSVPPETDLLASPWFWVGVGALIAAGVGAAVVLTAPADGRVICVRLEGADCDE